MNNNKIKLNINFLKSEVLSHIYLIPLLIGCGLFIIIKITYQFFKRHYMNPVIWFTAFVLGILALLYMDNKIPYIPSSIVQLIIVIIAISIIFGLIVGIGKWLST